MYLLALIGSDELDNVTEIVWEGPGLASGSNHAERNSMRIPGYAGSDDRFAAVMPRQKIRLAASRSMRTEHLRFLAGFGV